jgi:TPR repeat protein
MSRTLGYARIAFILFATLGLLATASKGSEPSTLTPSKFAEIKDKAEHGSVRQEIELGTAYFNGNGVPQDNRQAALWYERAAQAGDPAAQNLIAYLYQAGIGVPADNARAVHWYQLAAAGGLSEGKLNLGVVYLNGKGLPRDTSMAERLFREAVRKGNGTGAAFLGDMYFFGIGVPQNPEIGESWFQTGVKLHDAFAEFCMGSLYSVAPNHPHDIRKAAALMRMAVEQGYVPAMHSLGLLLVNHPVSANSSREAATIFETAASAGHWKSSILLGIMARDGNGLPADPRNAFYHFRVASLQGGPEAQRLVANDLKALDRQLPAETRSQIEASAHAWYEEHHLQLAFIGTSEKSRSTLPVVALEVPSFDTHVGELVPPLAFQQTAPPGRDPRSCASQNGVCPGPEPIY